MSRCDLYLDNYDTHYTAGQQIVGRVKCKFNTEKKVAGIHVKITGTVDVSWKENTSKNRNVHYYAHQSLINNRIDVLPVVGDSLTVPAGEYTYPFQFTLPAHLPATHVSHLGNIIYKICATVDRPWKFDYTVETPILVQEFVDLKRDLPNSRVRVEMLKEKMFGLLCWSHGPLQANLRMAHTGFVPGLPVPLQLHVKNMSRTNIVGVTFQINQHVQYCARNTYKTRNLTHHVLEVREKGVGAHGEGSYDVALTIPRTFQPSNMLHCEIINITYTLNLKVIPDGCHMNLTLTTPIHVGNVALDATADQPYPFPGPAPIGFPTTTAPYPPMPMPHPTGMTYSALPYPVPSTVSGATAGPSAPPADVGSADGPTAPPKESDLMDWTYLSDDVRSDSIQSDNSTQLLCKRMNQQQWEAVVMDDSWGAELICDHKRLPSYDDLYKK